jgi:hypothetical protein
MSLLSCDVVSQEKSRSWWLNKVTSFDRAENQPNLDRFSISADKLSLLTIFLAATPAIAFSAQVLTSTKGRSRG